VRTIGLLTGGFSEQELREAGAIAVHRRLADVMADLGDMLDAAAPAEAG
jgi:hypothetical protein